MNVGHLGKLIVTKGFEKLPKVQKIALSGHTQGLTFGDANISWSDVRVNYLKIKI